MMNIRHVKPLTYHYGNPFELGAYPELVPDDKQAPDYIVREYPVAEVVRLGRIRVEAVDHGVIYRKSGHRPERDLPLRSHDESGSLVVRDAAGVSGIVDIVPCLLGKPVETEKSPVRRDPYLVVLREEVHRLVVFTYRKYGYRLQSPALGIRDPADVSVYRGPHGTVGIYIPELESHIDSGRRCNQGIPTGNGTVGGKGYAVKYIICIIPQASEGVGCDEVAVIALRLLHELRYIPLHCERLHVYQLETGSGGHPHPVEAIFASLCHIITFKPLGRGGRR